MNEASYKKMLKNYNDYAAITLGFSSFREMAENSFLIFKDKTYMKGKALKDEANIVFCDTDNKAKKLDMRPNIISIYPDMSYSLKNLINSSEFFVSNFCVFISDLETKPESLKDQYDELFRVTNRIADAIINDDWK